MVKWLTSQAWFRGSMLHRALRQVRHPIGARDRRREARFYRELLGHARFGLIFDIGASHGGKAELFREHAQVVCVEPSSVAAENLRRRFVCATDVHVVEAAISDTNGTGVLFEFAPGSAYNTLSPKWAAALSDKESNPLGVSMACSRETAVPLTTIDALTTQFGRPRYIKLDVEGCEWLALKGMRQPCELMSAEFNLPEFSDELAHTIAYLDALAPDARFNAAISEPPRHFEFGEWLPGSAALARIHDAGWRYVELYCRTPSARISPTGRSERRDLDPAVRR